MHQTLSSDGLASDQVDLHVSASEPTLLSGDARDLSHLPAASVDCVVTSPPYWKRRDYGHPDQLGQEPTPEAFIANLVETLGGWIPLLKPHASLFINLGDTYRGGFLVGIPARFEVAARAAGWNVLNDVRWTKDVGMPERNPLPALQPTRTGVSPHASEAAKDVFVDLYALTQAFETSANPGDVWPLHMARSQSNHLAPFPPELAHRALLMGCPERVCSCCGRAHRRVLAPSPHLDARRQQAVRAMELAREHGLTEAHFAAIRAVGISDAGKGKALQTGTGRNRPERAGARAGGETCPWRLF